MYQELLKNYGDNDTKIYEAIKTALNLLGVTQVHLTEEEEFHFEGTEETCKKIVVTNVQNLVDSILQVEGENDSDGETFEYDLVDDTLSQLDKLQVLAILENRLDKN